EHNFDSSMPQWLSEILDIFFASADQAMRAFSELRDGVEVRGKLVLQQLAQYGIEHLETVRVPEDIAYNKKVKAGDTKTRCSVGRDVSPKVSFEQSAKPSNDEDVPQDEDKVKEICEKYGEIVNIDLHQRSKPKHKDFRFAVKVNPHRVLLMFSVGDSEPSIS
ncbi:hypothetical protein Tco_0673860, partial [Tanacetum coccineum]